ncbi:hypothetical protein JOB18_042610 [Solea senegalensis]|uniref:Uncharacterized protein n=1 Tax=Solea senegalensis TaxID=28829 RepID=A0AAV6PIV5_SOLSE|nr:hypothetical protein JOB18_042610 [Solea senegalensis]
MQPFQYHLTHIPTPTTPPAPISRVTVLLFHILVPVHRRSGGIHTTLSPGMIIHTKRAACWPPGMKSPPYRALHGSQSYTILQKHTHREKKKDLSSRGDSLVKKPNPAENRLNLL